LHSKLAEFARLLETWPGLIAGPALPLVDDCLTLLGHLGDARTVVDVGSGGGMPGLPLKIARPDLDLTLVEADQRKAAFLAHASADLGLQVQVVADRAEVAGHGPLRERFDLAVCRALATLPVVVELCLPLVRVGGTLLAMKTGTERLEEARWASATLGGGTMQLLPAPSSARRQGALVVVTKVAPTPADYPRRPGQPNKRPLRPPRA
jgi:16S rRNA (guanine527-N7)-methyltransferase